MDSRLPTAKAIGMAVMTGCSSQERQGTKGPCTRTAATADQRTLTATRRAQPCQTFAKALYRNQKIAPNHGAFGYCDWLALSYNVENRTGGLWFDLEGQPLDRGGIWNLHGAHGERLETVSISSVRANESGQKFEYYPYGEEITVTNPQDREKFATCARESATGLDYADQRYYASTYGIFTRPDSYKSGGVGNQPGSWNRYADVQGDPIILLPGWDTPVN